MPNHRAKITATLAGLIFAAAALAGCTVTAMPDPAEVPTAAVSSEATPPGTSTPPASTAASTQEQYEAAVETFPYALPGDNVFPSEMPMSEDRSMAGDVTAYWWWGCSTLESAWSDAERGDAESADAKFAVVIEAIEAERPGLRAWETEILSSENLPHGPGMGTSGICHDWLANLDIS